MNSLTELKDAVARKQTTWNMDPSILYSMQTGECVTSPSNIIKIGCCETDKWNLQLYPRGSKAELSGYISIFLCRMCKCAVKVKYEFEFLCNDEMRTRELSHVFLPNEPRWGFPKFTLRQTLFDKMKFFSKCSVTFSYEVPREPKRKKQENDNSVTSDIGRLLCNQTLTDITLTAGERDFPVHRALLAARSNVLEDMIKTTTSDTIQLYNIAPEVLREVLFFIYTDTCPNLESMAESLLAAAADLKISKLFQICEEELIKTLDVANVSRRVVIASVNEAKALMEQGLMFIAENAVSVCKTTGWDLLCTLRPELMAAAFEKLAIRKQNL